MRKVIIFPVILFILILLSGCSTKSEEVVRIGINPWPGYEFLYLANQKHFFAEEGLNIEIHELASLADVKRVFEQGRIDGMASTVIEAVQVASQSAEEINLVLIPDYSNGGDIIVAREPVQTIAELKGKKVGVELGMLGSFILSKAMETSGMSLSDVTEVNIEQLSAEQAMLAEEIDAIVTYPPFSNQVLKHEQFKTIFSTALIPEQVIDTVALRSGTVNNLPEWQEKFHNAWQRALDYATANPDESYGIMAKREGITPAEFEYFLGGARILSKDEQSDILGSESLKANIEHVCQTLVDNGELDFDCQKIHQKLIPVFLHPDHV